MLILSIKNLFFTAVIFCIFGSIELNSATTQISTEKSESKEWDIIDKIKKYLDNVYPSTKSGLMNILEDWRTEGLQKIKDSGQNKDSDPFTMDKKISLLNKFDEENIKNLIDQMKNDLERNLNKSRLQMKNDPEKNRNKSRLMNILENFCKDLSLSSFSVSSKEEDKVDYSEFDRNALLEELEIAIQKESKYLNNELSIVTKSKLTYLVDNFKLKISRVIRNFDKDKYIYSSVKKELKEYLNLNSDELKKPGPPSPQNLTAYCVLVESAFNKIFDKADQNAATKGWKDKLLEIGLAGYNKRDPEDSIKKLAEGTRVEDLKEALRIYYIVKAKRELSYFLSKSKLKEELLKEFDKVDTLKIEKYFKQICIKISSIKNNLDSDTYFEEKDDYNHFSLTKDKFEEFKTKFEKFLTSTKEMINEFNENFDKTKLDESYKLMEKLIELVQYTNEKEKSAKKIEANMKKEKISKR